MQEAGRFGSESLREYKAQVDDETRNKYVADFQKRVDAIQEEIDTYNYTTEIPWDEPGEDEKIPFIEEPKAE